MPDETKIPQHLIDADALLRELIADGELGGAVRAKAKAKFPTVTFPEDRVDPLVAPLRDQLTAANAKIAEIEAARAAEKAAAEEAAFNQTFAQKVESAVGSYKLNADGRDKMLARMKETGNIYDPEAAAAWVVGQEPPPKPVGPSWAPQDANFFGSSEESQDAKVRMLHKNPEKFFDTEVGEILAEFAAA
jgi:hypothetical protein